MVLQEAPELNSSHRDTKITSIYRANTDDHDLKTGKLFPLKQKYKEGTTIKQRTGDNRVKNPKWETHKHEDNDNCNDSLPKWEGSEPHFELPSQGILHLRGSGSKIICLRRPVGLTFGGARRLGSGQKQSFVKGLGQTCLIILQSLLEKQGEIETHSGDVDASSSPLGELSQDSWQAPFWNPPPSFVVIGPSPSHQPVYVSIREPLLGCQLGRNTTSPTSSLATRGSSQAPATHNHLYPPG